MNDSTFLDLLAALHAQRVMFAERALRAETRLALVQRERDYWYRRAKLAYGNGYEVGRTARRREETQPQSSVSGDADERSSSRIVPGDCDQANL